MELVKHADWAQTGVRLYHYRQERDEVDIVLESRAGTIATVEVKAAATVDRRDTRPMAKLRDRRREHFVASVVMYAGRQTIPLGERLWAVPFSGLWSP
jgi:hypothetical protein